ncbi:hypothetical protein RO3G_11157 [Rhizopus delemar RA 99-880]|uniref:Uncharacterized protein n=1 Tax=Rhizopus delemar (strain RA 99-880 / ATCC MYA-4621 / FGSC 9543 / NRRL 43880) TaxID=246409 RepID=I1CDB6_RHIO9|nr:hypothetical protein RO3G_11157 [Rhizopus delemar RA 99-880]|eukprot:EIE86446.1 hypothetical protein RO3G_11157 [Rhizopus delemar RA 99-880]
MDKLKQSFIDLDQARCDEKWQDISELAKKYKKYHPQESVLEITARIESEFIQHLNQARNSGYSADYIHALDDPNHIAISKRLDPAHVQLILFSKIILARIYFETARFDKALEWLQQLALRLEDVERGYGLVLLVQARVIKGRCFEQEQDDEGALESYLSALSVVENHPDEKNKALNSWVEDCLYRSVLLQLRRKGAVKQTLRLMRSYLHYCNTKRWPMHWRIHKRWIIFRHYIRYLTRAYQKGVYVPVDKDDLTLELCHLLVSAHDTVGWGPKDYSERILKFFYNARVYTFNSPTLCRHMVNLSDKKTCILATKNYLELLGIKNIQLTARDEDGSVLHEMVETIGKKLQLVTHDSSNSASCHLNSVEKRIVDILTSQGSNSNEEQGDAFSSSLKPKSETATVKRKLPPGAYENDNELDVVCTLLIAVKRVYADMPNEEEGLILCDLAVALLEEADGLKKKKMNQWKSLMVQCRRIRGCLYGLCALQCNEPEKRLNCLNESLVSLSKATELDPHSWQAFYELGLHQAISGDRSQAMASIKRSVELNPDFIPGWHLLALLQKHLSQALVILQYVSDKHTIDEQDTLEKAMLFMRIKMCQLSVLEELEGPCTEGYTSLFFLFFKLSKKLNLLPTVVSKSQSISSSTSKSLPSTYSKTSSGFLSENSSNMSLQTIESIESSHEDDQDEKQLENKQGLDKVIEGEQEHQVGSESGISLRSSFKNNSDLFKAFPNEMNRASHQDDSVTEGGIEKSYSTLVFQQAEKDDNKERWKQMLVQLWIMASSSYLRNKQYDEAFKAIQEADQLTDGVNADVWHQIGKVLIAQGQRAAALDAFKKSLVIEPEHGLTCISLASVYLDMNEYELAEYLLEKTTRGTGWNQPEAWYLLSKVYMKQENLIDAKQCLMYALQLSETNTIQPLNDFPRFL